MSKVKIGIGAVGVFSAGYFLGAVAQAKAVKKRANYIQPVLANSIISIMQKFQENEMTYDEIKAYAAEELAFMQIVIRNGA